MSSQVLSSQVEPCRVFYQISAKSPSCLLPAVRSPPGAALRTVQPSVMVATRLSGRDCNSSHGLLKSGLLVCSSFSWVIFHCCICLIRLANGRLPEFVLWTINPLLDLPLPLGPFLLWQHHGKHAPVPTILRHVAGIKFEMSSFCA